MLPVDVKRMSDVGQHSVSWRCMWKVWTQLALLFLQREIMKLIASSFHVRFLGLITSSVCVRFVGLWSCTQTRAREWKAASWCWQNQSCDTGNRWQPNQQLVRQGEKSASLLSQGFLSFSIPSWFHPSDLIFLAGLNLTLIANHNKP